MTVRDIIESVTLRYNDSDYIRITEAQYLKFLDDSILALLLVRPDAHVQTEIVGLVAGSRQSIPTTGYSLIDIYRNKSGSDPDWVDGSPIFQVERKDLDAFSNWHATSGAITEIDEFSYDARSPKTFWVSPAPTEDDAVHVEMDYSYGVDSYSELTDDFDTILDLDIPIEDIFRPALIAYMLFLCFSVDSSATSDISIAAKYEETFQQALGLEHQAAQYVEPKINQMPPRPAGGQQ